MMDPINTALASYGMSGQIFHAPFLHCNSKFNLIGSWERSKKMISADYPGATSYESFEQLLKDDRIELVIINTPNYTHFDFAKKALLAGKHIVVEKPFTVTVAEGEELISIGRRERQTDCTLSKQEI